MSRAPHRQGSRRSATSARWARVPGTLARRSHTALLLLPPDGATLVKVNVSGAAVWAALGATDDEEVVVASVGERFGVPPDAIAAPVHQALEQLAAQGVVRRVDG